MRVYIFILCIALSSICNELYAQKFNKISLNLENVTVFDVFQRIQSQSDYFFFYQDNLINGNKKVSIKVRNWPVSEILDRVLEPQNLDYKIVERQIVIVPKTEAYNFEVEKKPVETRTISGIVTDFENEKLAGVTIWIKNVRKGTGYRH